MRKAHSILIIDDEKEWHELFADSFGGTYQVAYADELTWRESLQRRAYDIIVLDISLGETLGTDVFVQLRQLDRRCVVVVWTVLPTYNESVRWFLDRHVAVVSKQDPEEGLTRINEVVQRWSFKDPEEIRALIVDDDPENRVEYEHLLRAGGVTHIESVETINRAAEVLIELSDSQTYDLVLLDTYFPSHSEDGSYHPVGTELARKLIEQGLVESMSVLLITTKDSRPHIEFQRKPDIRCIDITRMSLEIAINEGIQRGPFSIQMVAPPENPIPTTGV